MLSNVLNSKKATNMSIQIIRVFDKLRKYADKTIRQIVHGLNNLIERPQKAKTIGFNAG